MYLILLGSVSSSALILIGCMGQPTSTNVFPLTGGDCGCSPAGSGPNHDGCRGGSVTMQCGSGSVVVTESSTCVYAVTMTDPSFCCQAGYYGPSGGSYCIPCPAGQYSATSGSSTCTVCPAGQYSSSGSSSCTLCAAGTNSSLTGSSSCAGCPAGTYASSAGSATCTLCPSALGLYSSVPGSSSCLLLPVIYSKVSIAAGAVTNYYYYGGGNYVYMQLWNSVFQVSRSGVSYKIGYFGAPTSNNVLPLSKGDCGCASGTGPNLDGCRGGSITLSCGTGNATLVQKSTCVYSIAFSDPTFCCPAGYYGLSGGPYCVPCPAGTYLTQSCCDLAGILI
jgi:hypothetical protein